MRSLLMHIRNVCPLVLCAFMIGRMWIAGILMLPSPVWIPVTVALLVAKMLGRPA